MGSGRGRGARGGPDHLIGDVRSTCFIGTAGWSIPAVAKSSFVAEGPNLARYAERFAAVEINSSFYRPHKRETYARWAASTPDGFRFAVKVPKAITHERRLVDSDDRLTSFLGECAGLGHRLGCLLVQLPPTLALDEAMANAFFAALRSRYDGPVAVEPRHASWFDIAAARLLARHELSRVAADPARVPEAAEPAGHDGTVYFRLHGSPQMYRSTYDDAWLDTLAARLRIAGERAAAVWCIFDNTMLGGATMNALGMLARMDERVVDDDGAPVEATPRPRPGGGAPR